MIEPVITSTTPPPPAPLSWFVGDVNQSCDTVCQQNGLSCEDGEWGITDPTSFEDALIQSNSGLTCDSFGTYSGVLAPFIEETFSGGQQSTTCKPNSPSALTGTVSWCESSDDNSRRLCYCY